MSTRSLFEKLAAEEEKFFGSEFLSPVIKGNKIRVRISDVTVELSVTPKKFEGWGIFRCKDQKIAKHVREPSMAQKRQYLDLYPRFSVVVCQRGDRTLGLPANQSDKRFVLQGLVPVSLPGEVQLFETIDVRYDGQNFWFDQHSNFRSPRIATHLRETISEETKPEDVSISGITEEEKFAYALAFDIQIESKIDKKEERLKKALERGGALLKSYVERGASYTVEYTVDGQTHRSTVDAETLQVTSAGICLTDHSTGVAHDSDFDLQSLVSVIREGQNRHLIYRW